MCSRETSYTQNDRQRSFSIGQPVMARNYRERPDWLPGTVLEVLGPVTYHVKVNSQVWKRHIDQLKLLLKPQATSAPLNRETSEQLSREFMSLVDPFTQTSTTSSPHDLPTLTNTDITAEDTRTPPQSGSRYPRQVRRPLSIKGFTMFTSIRAGDVINNDVIQCQRSSIRSAAIEHNNTGKCLS